MKTTGIHEEQNFFVVATPSIIVDKPITLVGMGDTISSLSGIAIEMKNYYYNLILLFFNF